MKVNAVISKPKVKLNFADRIAVISALVIALGLVSGSIIYSLSKNDILNTLCEYFLSFVSDFANKNKPEILSGLILSNIPYFIMMVMFGTNVVGTPAVFALTYIKSMGIGLLNTYIYDSFNLKGIEFSLLVLLPGKFILIFAMILLTQNCFVTSKDIRKSINNNENGVVSLNKFFIRSVIIGVLFVISSIIDFVTLTSFSAIFDFS